MTIFNHAAVTYTLCDALNLNEGITVFLVLGAIMPDLFGYVEKIYYHNFKTWRWYLYCHKYHWWEWLVPSWLLHIYLDKFVHDPNGGWNNYALYFEAGLWFVIILYFILKIHLLDIF